MPQSVLLTSCEKPDEAGDQEAKEGKEVEGSENSRESFVVASQPAETGSPGEASFQHPFSRQQNKAAFGLGTARQNSLSSTKAKQPPAITTVLHGQPSSMTGLVRMW
jgi:hypothetical protein